MGAMRVSEEAPVSRINFTPTVRRSAYGKADRRARTIIEGPSRIKEG